MDLNKHKTSSKNMEAQVSNLQEKFNTILSQNGFEQFKVISFRVAHRDVHDSMRTFAGSPCPTKCRVLPTGEIECGPDCS